MFETEYETTKERASAVFESLSKIQHDVTSLQAVILGDESMTHLLGGTTVIANATQGVIHELIKVMAGPKAAILHETVASAAVPTSQVRPRKETLPPLIGPDGLPVRRGPGRPSKVELEARAAAKAEMEAKAAAMQEAAVEAESAAQELSPAIADAVKEAEVVVGAAVAAKAKPAKKPAVTKKANAKKK